MPITLADAQNLSQNKLTKDVIDEFRKSPLLDMLPFDNTVKPQGGKSLAYAFNRITTQPTAGTRAINGEYVAQETKTTPQVSYLKIMGGAYEIDRVIAEDETQVVNHIAFQSNQKAKATVAEFNDLFINGNSSDNATEFDGIEKAVSGTTTEIDAGGLDMTTADNIKANAYKFLFLLRQLKKNMDGEPTHYLMNADMYAVFQTVADYVPNVRYTKDEMGNDVLKYGAGVIVEMGDKPGTSNPIIATTAPSSTAFGTSDIYAVRIGLDGVHGVSPEGSSLVKTYLPDLKAPGAVKKGEVEMVAAIAVKATRAVGKIKGIAVLPKTKA